MPLLWRSPVLPLQLLLLMLVLLVRLLDVLPLCMINLLPESLAAF